MTFATTSAIHTPTRPRQTFWRALAVNSRIIGALIMREGTMHFGHENLGFFWVIGEPLVLTCGVMLMWTIGGQTHGHGIGVVPFALSGYTMITLWRHLSGKQVHSIRNSMGLLFHRNISLIDALLARSLLEVVAILTAFFVAFIPLSLLGFVDPMNDPLLFAGGYFLQAWFGVAFGLCVSALSEMYEATEQFLPPLLYITLPFTGVFNMADWLPQEWREAVLWSPLVSNIEMMRAGMFGGDIKYYYDPMYVVYWSLGLTAIGLPLVQRARRHVAFN
ncbi:MAG: ABC transporter permease [Pseudomonadota bacterium]|nr:ABC transporter permease [Pseudomonadota bacterium]